MHNLLAKHFIQHTTGIKAKRCSQRFEVRLSHRPSQNHQRLATRVLAEVEVRRLWSGFWTEVVAVWSSSEE